MSALNLVIFACFQLLFTDISAASLNDVDSAHRACYRSTDMSDVMEGIYFPDSIAAFRIINNYITCILRILNAINSNNSLNAEIVESAIHGMRQMELLNLTGQRSDQRKRISNEALSQHIPICVTEKGITAEHSVIKLFECLFRRTGLPIF